MPAFRIAMEVCAGGIELDVHLTKDEVPVVIHDETADRTGTATGRIVDKTFKEWQPVDFGIWKGARYAGAHLPSLKEVLALLKPWDGWLNIELKTDVIRYEGIEAAVLALVAEAGMQNRVVISSFHHESLMTFLELDSGVETAALIGRDQVYDAETLFRKGIRAIHPDARIVTPVSMKKWHALGLKVRPWTIDWRLPALWEACLGADAIITNRPKEIIAFLKPFFRG